MKRVIATILMSTFAASCQSSGGGTATTSLDQIPADHRAQIVQMFRKTLQDPYSVRDAEISAPLVLFTSVVEGGNHPGFCVQFNSKNSFGAYTGIQTMPVWFYGGPSPGFFAEDPLNRCANAAGWTPFPELQGS
nr:hypothetical protein P9270_018515 [Mesorhizobium sp. WSM4875]